MAEEPTAIRQIDWSAFPFTRIFNTFRVCLQPGKLVLALAGVVSMGVLGLVLDALWPARYRAVGDEVNAFWQVPCVETWREEVAQPARLERIRAAYTLMETTLKIARPQALDKDLEEKPGGVVGEALENLRDHYRDEVKAAKGDRQAVALAASRHAPVEEMLQSARARGLFRSFLGYQKSVLRQALTAARGLNFMGQLEPVLNGRHRVPSGAGRWTGALKSIRNGADGIGTLTCVVLALRGVQWMVFEHFWFAVLFLLGSLAIWSLFGGAICRMAALSIARDERLSLTTALGFARRKFFSFLAAPLLPIVLILVIGVFLFLGGLVVAIPYVGEIIGGVGMILALLGGFVIAMVIVGGIAGGSLLWPTIAVEGSDCFDAMSRSYSYVYSKPWRTVVYAALATVYGALVWLFARFFVLLMLVTTRFFVTLGVHLWPTYRPGTGLADAKKMDALWPQPTFESLMPGSSPLAMEDWDAAGAWLVHHWVLLVASALGALMISFYFCGSTIIYFLLRHKVDATDLEDVYLDSDESQESPEASAQTTPAMAAGGQAQPSVAPESPPSSPSAYSAPPTPDEPNDSLLE